MAKAVSILGTRISKVSFLLLVFAFSLFLAACGGGGGGGAGGGTGGGGGGSAFTLQAPWQDGGNIDQRYAFDQGNCGGQNISPQISWSGHPSNTQSFVIIMDDPDAPGGTFTHWVVYDIPANQTSLQENFPTNSQVGNIKQGVNDFGTVGYGGPCPPPGETHRYFIKVYALNIQTLGLSGNNITRQQVENAMQGRIIGQAQIMGKYSR